MAKISQFHLPDADVAERASELIKRERHYEPDEIRHLRLIAESEDLRVLLGDLFMRVAASEPIERATPYADLLKKLLGEHDVQCEKTLQTLMGNLDLLRSYDIMIQQRKKLRQMLKETKHGLDIIEKSESGKEKRKEKAEKRKEAFAADRAKSRVDEACDRHDG